MIIQIASDDESKFSIVHGINDEMHRFAGIRMHSVSFLCVLLQWTGCMVVKFVDDAIFLQSIGSDLHAKNLQVIIKHIYAASWKIFFDDRI